jgi:hypothetical protein
MGYDPQRHRTESIAQAYIHLALAIERHIPGYVDAYYGPPEWRQQAQAVGPRPVADLLAEATALAARVAADVEMDRLRRDYLSKEMRAMQAVLCTLEGKESPFAEEVEALYDITPQWVSETVFEEAHRILEEYLPSGPSLFERMAARRKATEVSAERVQPLLHVITAELRRRTLSRFRLPAAESLEIRLVENEPWAAYNWYLGDFRSRIDVNTDLPLHAPVLVNTMAHEGYPGHHTDHSIKEQRLVQERDYIEFSITILHAPSCVMAEGTATQAMSMVLSEDEWVTWHTDELFPRAGLDHLDADRERAIDQACQKLDEAVLGNVAFMLHDQGADEEETVAYMQRYSLTSEPEARHLIPFLSNRLLGSYVFNYGCGRQMLDALFAARGDRNRWFAQLLTQPITPSQVRAWTEGG